MLVPSNRIAPVAANALATLNQLAPGRIDFGVGTGFTARRAMGFGAIKVKDMETYIHQVYGLLRRETVEFEMEGQRKRFVSSIPSCLCSTPRIRSRSISRPSGRAPRR